MKKFLALLAFALLASGAHAQQPVVVTAPLPCFVTTSAPTYVPGIQGNCSMTPAGLIRVDASATAILGTTAGIDPAAGNILAVQGVTGNTVSGTANTTATTTTSLISLVAAKKLYITAFYCANTGATASLISFQDGSGGTTLGTTIVSAGGGSNSPGAGLVPLFHTTAGNALFFAAASASTTIYCSASGFSGS